MPIDATESRPRVAEFLASHGVGVLATADASGKPHAATVYFTSDQQLDIYFITKQETQKWRNLQAQPWAALAVYDASAQKTLQAQGQVVQVTDSRQQEWVFHDIWKRAAEHSPGNPPPFTQLLAGGYVICRLSAPSLRLATFIRPENVGDADIFEIVHTQPSP